MMEQPKKSQTGPSRRASSEFLADKRDKLVREQLQKERAVSTAKTAKLRALRLAKEEADRQAEEKRKAENPLSSENFRIVRRK
jgi:hypothetical protein